MNEKKILEALEQCVIKSVHKGDLLKIPYESKLDIGEFYKKVYSRLDKDKLYSLIKEGLEQAIAKKIVDKITTEMGTDIKNMMSNANIRDEFKFALRKNIDLVLEKLKG
jgi:hypothetical protein